MHKAHSFPRAVEFRAEPSHRICPFSAEFRYCRRISWNFAEVDEWPM